MAESENMIERVARVMCCPRVCMKGDGPFSICQAHTFIEDAKAAIAAMGKPTDEVADALDRVPGGWGRGAWQAGIDAALEPKPSNKPPAEL